MTSPKMLVKKGVDENAIKNNFQISFESFGVKIGIRADSENLITRIENALSNINPNGFKLINCLQVEHLFEIKPVKNQEFEIIKDGELLVLWKPEDDILPYLQTQIRLTVAEFAESKIFLHAGAVSWKKKAIILPAKSFSGKSTLVAELIKRGASYYSDDFAVLDQDGLLHPFHRPISLRGFENKYEQVDFSVESLGGKVSFEPVPVGLVLIARYREGKKIPKIWKPQILSSGQGIMEMLSHTIPIRYKPKFSLEVLNKVTKHAIICKSQRGEASEFVSLLLNFFETHVIK